MTATRVFDMVDTVCTDRRQHDTLHIVDLSTHDEIALSDLATICRNISSNLLDYDIRRGEYVALVKTDCFAECLACLCLQKIGAIPMIISNDMSAEEYIETINSRAVRHLFVGNEQSAESFRLILPQMPHLLQLFTYEHHSSLPSLCDMATKENSDTQQIARLEHRTSIATTDDVALCLSSTSSQVQIFTHKQFLHALSASNDATAQTQLACFLRHLLGHDDYQGARVSIFATDKKKKKSRNRLALFFLSAF